ncbi:unnamed protein product [Nesidiocoris tenuis]|uniref:Uncharacterized protein n=1 Tax=Nesidiocoris tenuis TaxID=355587 RepID=A0A6H5GXP5_9HEMI|nr:unnamed protein product [Nesidiocoris tenuis]
MYVSILAGHGGSIPSNEECGIRDVWAHNLKEEFKIIRKLVHKYNYVAMVSILAIFSQKCRNIRAIQRIRFWNQTSFLRSSPQIRLNSVPKKIFFFRRTRSSLELLRAPLASSAVQPTISTSCCVGYYLFTNSEVVLGQCCETDSIFMKKKKQLNAIGRPVCPHDLADRLKPRFEIFDVHHFSGIFGKQGRQGHRGGTRKLELPPPLIQAGSLSCNAHGLCAIITKTS